MMLWVALTLYALHSRHYLSDHQRHANQGTDQVTGQPTRNKGHDEAVIACKYHCINSLSLLYLGNDPLLDCFFIPWTLPFL
jgi:hypothetical protein